MTASTIPSRHRHLLLVLVILVLVAAYVFNASIPGRRIEGCPAGCATATPRAGGPLRLVSLNMLHGIPWFTDLDLRIDLIAAELQRLDADVVLLQEVPWTVGTGNVAGSLARRLGFNHLYYRANGNKYLLTFEEGEAILSRFPLSDPVARELHPDASFFQNRVVLGATALTPWGELRLFSTHLTHSNPAVNAGQVPALQRFVEGNTSGMAVVGGDFNATDDTVQMADLASRWTDTYRAMHPADPGHTCCIDDLSASPGQVSLHLRIDYLFLVDPAWELSSAGHAFYTPFRVPGGWQWASDHTGLVVEIAP